MFVSETNKETIDQEEEKDSIKVQVKENLKGGLILGLHARPTIGNILGFVGYSHEVMPLMQTLSHGTRAYIVNTDGLPGFVKNFDIENADIIEFL